MFMHGATNFSQRASLLTGCSLVWGCGYWIKLLDIYFVNIFIFGMIRLYVGL